MNKCLWCNRDTESLFCPGGGQTLANSNTGEGIRRVTKSYCYNDFLTFYNFSLKNRYGLTERQKQYHMFIPDVKEWYKALEFTLYEEVSKVTV